MSFYNEKRTRYAADLLSHPENFESSIGELYDNKSMTLPPGWRAVGMAAPGDNNPANRHFSELGAA